LQISERVNTPFDEIEDFTVVVLSRNHERFMFDCLNSINRELSDAKVICADIGSQDNSYGLGEKIAKECGLNARHIQLSEDTKTLTALKKLESYLDTKYVILISADDALGENYRIALNNVRKSNPHESVINFTSTLTDENLRPLGSRTPSWRESPEKNRNLLSFSNPGTAPGSVIPWYTLTKQIAWKNPPDILIEDYWIWWQLIGLVPFLNCYESSGLYRQHGHNISNASKNKNYAYSLGYVTAIPNIRASNSFNKLRSLLLIVRWIRHLSLIVWPNFVKGYFDSKESGKIS
jgi:hypothetical protein